jgi:gamma-glutamyltranspeptidase/glutathione hydrolase
VDSPEAQHLEIEAMKLAFADVYRYVADPRTMEVTPVQMLEPAYLAARARLIDRKRAQDFKHGTPPRAGTVYLTAADASGMMVSLIQSNYMGFGSGIVVPGTGISLQNRGTGFSLQADHPNRVGPGKRPFHTIIPAFVTRDGAPYATFGVMGGPIQPQGHVQTLVRLIDYRQQPQAVLDAPRWKVNAGVSLDIESGMTASVRDGLAALGHEFASISDAYMDFGAGQIIVRTENGYVAASDPRRDGQAAGF